MGELISRAVLVEGFENVDSDTRTLTLLEAADFDVFSELQIDRNFFTFTKNAAYLFRFFEELSGELVEIDALDAADTYGDFAEHIEILKLLRERYKNLCMSRKILERIFLPEYYTLNTEWLAAQEGFEITAEGYLTNFELRLLREMSAATPVLLRFEATPYNGKMQRKLASYGIETAEGHRYGIDLAVMKITETEKTVSSVDIRATPLSERILQSSFVKQKVYEMVNGGIAPERIAVVLPDEGFVPLLRPFDTEGNLNFAMADA